MLRSTVAVVAVCGIVVAGDLALTNGHTARAATVAGIDAGNQTPVEVTRVLEQLQEKAQQPITLVTPTGSVEVEPVELGLSLDSEATVDALMEQPRNPLTRLAALFGRETKVEPAVRVDRAAFDAALDARQDTLEKAAVEGGVHYRGATPIGDLPAAGERIDRDATVQKLKQEWLDTQRFDLPMEPFQPTVDADTVRRTVAGQAEDATATQLLLDGRDEVSLELSPEQIGSFLTFGPDGRGGLEPVIDGNRLRETLTPGLGRTEREPVDATFTRSGGAPSVVASREGAHINWEGTAKRLVDVLGAPAEGPQRQIEVDYEVLEPKLSTEDAEKLGVNEVISEFTTGGFESASGENIRLVANTVDGALVLPGDSFSLNGYTGPRGTAQGYVTSTIIDHGRASRAVGGGISQFATTLYNAAYFAGLEDVDHTEHAYYISRYPEAREATVFEGAIDLVFRNNTDYGVYIETAWSSSSITVRMWSTKRVNVESITGSRQNYTTPNEVEVPRGPNCLASSGSRGFTASDTRVITDANTGAEISRNTRTVRYDPEPIVRCV